MGQKLVTAQIIVDDTTGAVLGVRHNDVEYFVTSYRKNADGSVSPQSNPVTTAISAQIAALTTVGVASLSTAQTMALTTSQLSALCTNNDNIVSALRKLGAV